MSSCGESAASLLSPSQDWAQRRFQVLSEDRAHLGTPSDGSLAIHRESGGSPLAGYTLQPSALFYLKFFFPALIQVSPNRSATVNP